MSCKAVVSCDTKREAIVDAHEGRGHPQTTTSKPPLGTAALADTHSKNTYLQLNISALPPEAAGMKVLVALEHSILKAVWNMPTYGECYTDPGADYFIRLNPTKEKNKAIGQP